MKTINLFSLTISAIVTLASAAMAGPHGGGMGFGGGAQFGGGHFGGAHFGAYSGGIRAAPTLSRRGTGFIDNRSIVAPVRAPQQFSYYSGARSSATVPRMSARQLPNRSISSTANRVVTVNPQSNRVNPAFGQTRMTQPRTSTANRQSLLKTHAFARHNGSWHRNWDKHRAHFDHGHVFVFVGGSWWGLYPWDYYPYYGYNGDYPYDDSYEYPYDDSGYSYDGTDYAPSQSYGYYTGYAAPGQYSSTVVSAVQSKLASLGYYHGATDGILGDESEAALARYQQDQDLSVTGTVTPTTLKALGLPYSGSL